MDEQFITDGLYQNRYLKAQRLVDRFETEVTESIDEMCRSVRDDNPDLFETDATLSHLTISGSTLRTVRTEVDMTKTDDEDNSLSINVGLEWVEPDDQPDGIANVSEDTFCYVLYKIKYGSETTFEAVTDATEGQNDIYIGHEQWDTPPKVAPGIVYYPVETGTHIMEGLQVLEDHFSQVYGPELRT